MKALLTGALLLTSLTGHAICNREAQLVGTVKDLKVFQADKIQPDHFTFKIKLGYKNTYWFEPSITCALWEDEAEAATISILGIPTLKNGDQISGVLIFDEALQVYRIE